MTSIKQWAIIFLLPLTCNISYSQYVYDLVPYLDGRLYGFADLSGNVVIKPDFEEVKPFDSLGFADVVHYGLHGKINRKGEWAVPPMANNYKLTQVKNYNGKETVDVPGVFWATVYNNDRMCLFDTKKKGPNNNVFYKHHRGLKYLNKDLSRYFTYEIFEYGLKKVVFKDSSTNLMRTDGSFFYSTNQYNVDVINENLIVKAIDPSFFQFYDYKDNLVVKDTFTRMSVQGEGKYLLVNKSQNDYFGSIYILDKNGKKVIDKAFYKVTYLFDDLFFVSDGNGNRIINTKEKIIADNLGDEIQTACKKYFATSVRDSLFLFDKTGRQLLALKQGYLGFGYQYNYFIISSGNNYFLYNDDLKLIFKKEGRIFYVTPLSENSDELIISEEDSEYKTIIKTNGTIVLQNEGEIIYMPAHKAYFIRSKSRKGVFSSGKGWIYPLAYQRMAFEHMEKALYITKNKLIYRIQPDFKEVEFMKDSNDEVYTILEGDKSLFIYPDGEIITCPASSKIRPLIVVGSNERKLFYDQSDKSKIYDSTFTNILPDGFYLNKGDRFVLLKNKKTGFFVTDGNRIGLTNSKGHWLIPPLVGQRIRNQDFGFFSVQTQNKIVLYNQDYKPLPVAEGQRINVIDENLLALGSYDESGYQSFLVCDRHLNPLSDVKFHSYNYQKSVFVRYTTENGQKKTCFYNKNFSPDTCLQYTNVAFMNDSSGRFIVYDGKWHGVMDAGKKLIAPLKFKTIEYKEPFYFLQESEDKTLLLTEENEIKDLQCRMESVMYDEESKNYLLRNYDNGQNVMIDRKGSILSRFTGDYELLKKDDYYYFKDMLKGMDERYKSYYVNKWTGVVYRSGK
ncbi:MAG: WG repeat-containing protein [Saprospiraceae bacterium]|nr:WG repeat-containing protein [Saprospiraceae bacterium]